MEDWQKKIIEGYVKELVKVDGVAIDRIAREVGINQNVVYDFYIRFHNECYLKMIGGDSQ